MRNIRDFLRLLLPYRRKVAIAFVSILIANSLGLVFPWVIKIVIDNVLIDKDFFLLNVLTAGLILIFIVKFYFGFIREYFISSVGESVVCDIRNKLYWHLHRLSVPYIDNTSKGEIISGIIGDVESIRDFLFGGVIDFIYSFFNLLFVFVILFILDWKLTLISLVYLPIFGLAFYKLTPALREKHKIVRQKYAELTTQVNEVFNGIRVAAGFAKENYETRKFDLKQREIVKVAMGSHKLGILLWMGSDFIASLGLVMLIWFGARAVFAGRITPGTLIAFYSYLGMLFFPVVKMVVINSYYQEAAASMERINKVLAKEPRIKQAKHPVLLKNIKGKMRFEGVSFSYDEEKEVLREITFDVKQREVVALVGRSGAGKTTLINLLLRFYDPIGGAIFIDGYNLKDLELKTYRSRVAMVMQDDYLFNTTIKENILYSRPNASENEVMQVAQLASAHEFIIKLAAGYDTEIGEGGIKLSYGQRQRISIARALLRNPVILILDEATSSVDSESERLIIEKAYKNLMRDRTTFVITHRLSTITYADKIVFIDDGRLTETGSHFELLDKRGSYWRMWSEQITSYAPHV